MTPKEITTLIEQQLPVLTTNFHGITSANIHSFLVEPYLVMVDPDDLESVARKMWIVLEERGDAGYLIAYDVEFNSWAVVERGTNSGYTQILAANTLSGALDGM